MGRAPPTVVGPRVVITITKAARGKPRDMEQRLAGTRRKAAAVVERRKARLARGRERARLLVRAAARRQPETRDSVGRWHRLDADRRRGLGQEGGENVTVAGDVPGLWSGSPRVEGDRRKRAREDRAGLQGRAAVLRARAGAAPWEGRGRKRRREGDQGADLFGRTAAPRARQESVHLHSVRTESCPPSGSEGDGVGVPPSGAGPRSRGAVLQANAARAARG